MIISLTIYLKKLLTIWLQIKIYIHLESNKKYIGYLIKNDKIYFVGRTSNLLNYISVKIKEYDADTVTFYPIDNEYIYDIYVKSAIIFDMPNVQVSNVNRKYISLTTVKRVFKELYKLNAIHIRKIIETYDIEKFIIGNSIVLDKIKLDEAVRDYLQL